MLQGVCSPFFSQLARALVAEGEQVHRVHFNVGDMLYSRGASTRCQLRPDELDGFYKDLFDRQEVTDVVVFGDQRPVHKPAIKLAKRRGIRVHVFEEGYFRPYWVTLERSGVNANSLLPRDPAWYRDVGKYIPRYRNGQPFTLSFPIRAAHDVAYHLGGALNRICYPRYNTHAPYNAAAEYTGYIRRAVTLRRYAEQDRRIVEQTIVRPQPHFLLPLQLDSDAQIRDHSAFNDMRDVMDHVMQSFATCAPAYARLVVKNHPLSPGLRNYRKITGALARQHGLEGRVDFLESGHMPTLLNHVKGVVTVNSTAGASALFHQTPTIALSNPIYSMPGLTHQGGLDTFWQSPEKPDRVLFKRFRNTVIHTTQINGGFYTRDGIEMAAENAVTALLARKSRLEQYL